MVGSDMDKNNLHYYVYRENLNSRKIEKYNVLNDGVVSEIKKRVKDRHVNDKDNFGEAVRQILMYYYWSRSEYEIILTSWPPYISKEELARLNIDQEDHYKKYGAYLYNNNVNLTVSEKIDIYDQVIMNWNIFIDYLWENLK